MNDAGQPPVAAGASARLQRGVLAVLHLVMLASLAGSVYEQQWLNTTMIAAIMVIMFLPAALGRRFQLVDVPAEFEALAVPFIFAALFLGELRGYYARYWWWDIALHTTSGVLLGIFGFLLVFVLNASTRIEVRLRPRFVALSAFTFAVAVGTLWEIFEFALDRLAGTRMQKPMFGDPSGLTDTMWDLIVDALGAALISGLGGWYLHRGERSFIRRWIAEFVRRNPRLFKD